MRLMAGLGPDRRSAQISWIGWELGRRCDRILEGRSVYRLPFTGLASYSPFQLLYTVQLSSRNQSDQFSKRFPCHLPRGKNVKMTQVRLILLCIGAVLFVIYVYCISRCSRGYRVEMWEGAPGVGGWRAVR